MPQIGWGSLAVQKTFGVQAATPRSSKYTCTQPSHTTPRPPHTPPLLPAWVVNEEGLHHEGHKLQVYV